jgi:hypothetical protein
VTAPDQTNELRAAVEKLHGCSARFREWVTVQEDFQGKRAWERQVAVFDVEGIPICYAWSEAVSGSSKRRY